MKSKLEKPPKTEEEEQLDQALKEEGMIDTTCAILSSNCPDNPPSCKPMQEQLKLVQRAFVKRARDKLKKKN